VKRVSDGVIYFTDLKQVPDPAAANLTSQQALSGASALKAIADKSGKIVAVNPEPGTVGSLSQTYFEGPGSFRLDTNVIKRVRIRENYELQIREISSTCSTVHNSIIRTRTLIPLVSGVSLRPAASASSCSASGSISDYLAIRRRCDRFFLSRGALYDFLNGKWKTV